ncbi:unnamed protein product [Linum trigynum]|uniref:HMA domain-containing protein n=1 Tax=Linum trigynum TaxID=586398 RepID=A0AAV2G0N7_9ROSI
MGKKKNNNNGGGGNNNHNQNQNPNNGGGGGEGKQHHEEKKGGGGGGDGGGEKKKQEKNPLVVILKVEMHCEGCASKLIRLTRGLDGVESVKADVGTNKLTVMGIVDPVQIRDKLHEKTKKKVELISPQPKKDDGPKKNDNGGNNNNNNGKKDEKNPNEQKPKGGEEKKPKEAPVTTAVLKLAFHCQGCIEKIKKIVSKTKGVHELVAMDKQKETVTVKGTMNVKELVDALKERLKRSVEIVPPPKKEKEGGGGGNDGNGGGEKEGQNNNNNGGGGGKKKKGGGGGGGGGENGEGGQGQEYGVGEVSRMEFMVHPGYAPGPPGFAPTGFGPVGQPVYGVQQQAGNGYVGQPVYPGYGQEYGYGYGYGQVPGYPVHMKFNDENPNACSVM